MELTATQRQVVEHDGGPLLVLGSPGTGKTTVLIERWLRLGAEVTEPHRVLLLVPTRERALALRDELPWRLERNALIEVPVHTWHALAFHLVSRYYGHLGYGQQPVPLVSGEQSAVVRELLAGERAADWGSYGEHLLADAFVDEVADFCLRAGHRGLSEDDLADLGRVRPGHEAVTAFAVRYREHLRERGWLDYAGLVLEAARLIDDDDQIAGAVRQRFGHVLVDDAQELAPAQITLLRQLNTDHLVCVGDPDSSIEAFRGADPAWLDRFTDLVGRHQTLTLTATHRAGPAVMTPATELIAHATDAGPHRAATHDGPDGTSELKLFSTMAGELEATARTLRSANLLDAIPYDRMAVLLAQPGAYGHPLKRMLESFGIPFRETASDLRLSLQPAVRAMLDISRLALGDTSDDLCKAVLSGPLVGLHPYLVRDLARTAYIARRNLYATIEHDDRPELQELRRLVAAATMDPDEPADATFARIFDTSTWCQQLADRRAEDPEASHHIDSLVAMSRALNHFVERRPTGTMHEYLEASADAAFDADTWMPSGARSGVSILSFHKSRGEGWDVVCVLGVAEGQMPKVHRAQGLFDPWALDAGTAIDRAQAQLAEERRTLYVALTRATRRLFVSCSPGVRQATPSRFLEEAFGALPDPVTQPEAGPPLTVAEAVGAHRRTLADPTADDRHKAAAAAALAGVEGIEPDAWWFRRDWTTGPALYPDGKLTTSYSRISRYDECPLRYVLESVLGLDQESTYQMKFGSLVHKLIEGAERGEITSYEQMLSLYREEFMAHHKDDYPNLPFARTYYRFGVAALRRWWNSERGIGETVAVEYEFNDLDVEGHTIRGRIDRVAKEGSGLVLSDYKTAKNALPWPEVKESLQLAIYYAAAKEREDLRRHGEPSKMQLVYPGIENRRGPGCEKRIQTPDEAEGALVRLREMLEAASEERFAPSPEANCQWCKMRPLCPRWPEGKEVPK